MNGHVIVPNLIAVDYWKEGVVPYFFLTHCHGDHMSPRLQTWRKPIFTSLLNCQILRMLYNIPERLLKPLPLGETVSVGRDSSGFQVTAIDARHCPGSVLLLFQGSFGSILYTGDLRYWPGLLQTPALRYALDGGAGIDQLYLDNTYCSPECVFPPREVVLKDVITYLRDCGDCDIYIGMRELGKEAAVAAIAEALQSRVQVSQSRLRLLQLCWPSDVWTAERRGDARLHLVPFRQIGRHGADGEPASGGRPAVALLLTALFVGGQGAAPFSGGRVQIFPYSDHSSFPELCELVRQVRPRQVLPLVKRWAARGPFARRDLGSRCDMAVFRTYLRPARPGRRLDAESGPEPAADPDQPAEETVRHTETEAGLTPGKGQKRGAEVEEQNAGTPPEQETNGGPNCGLRSRKERRRVLVDETRLQPNTTHQLEQGVESSAQETIQKTRPELDQDHGEIVQDGEQDRDSVRERLHQQDSESDEKSASGREPCTADQQVESGRSVLRPGDGGCDISPASCERRPGGGQRPWLFTVVAGELLRLNRVLCTQQDLKRCLAASSGAAVSREEATSSCD